MGGKAKHKYIIVELLFAVPSVEFLDTTGSVNEFLLARVKGMAFRTNLQPDVSFCRIGLEATPACAGHDNLLVLRMNSRLHEYSPQNSLNRRIIPHRSRGSQARKLLIS